MLETLHVAALPYPTSQGTQAAIGLMLDALARRGRRTALLTYASGAGAETRFEHRVARGLRAPRSLRSGPSLEKIVADVALARALRRAAHEAEVVVAHHVEAALIAHAMALPRWVFVAHTELGPELPTYLPRPLGLPASRAGRALDRFLVTRAPEVAAISRHVARRIDSLSGRAPIVLPVPMAPIAPSIDRARAREALGLPASDDVVLYAGNLDAYQGLEVLVDAMRELRARRPRARLLVASESDPAALARRLAHARVASTFARLASEADRAVAHAAADLAVVTRGPTGGYPIKLLDGLARDVPLVAMRRALSGEDVPGVRVTADDAVSLARGLATTLDESAVAREAHRAMGRAHLTSRHGDASFLDAFDRVIARAAGAARSRLGA